MIIPDETDIKRGRDLVYNKSDAQVSAQIKSIKDVHKILRRGIGYAMAEPWLIEYNVIKFRVRAKQLGASEEQLIAFDESIKEIMDDQEAKREDERLRRIAKYRPIKDFLKEKFEARMLKKGPTTLRNLGNYRSFVGKSETNGDTMRIKKFEYDFGWQGYQRWITLRVWVSLTFIDGYFETQSTYGFYLEYHNGTFQLDQYGTRKSVILGKKDTTKLDELLKELKK
jgi:hypothetical protein